jgi:hypothetical protein
MCCSFKACNCTRGDLQKRVLKFSIIGGFLNIIVFVGIATDFGLRSTTSWIFIFIIILLIDIVTAFASYFLFPRLLLLCQIMMAIGMLGVIVMLIIFVPNLESEENNSDNSTATTTTTTTTITTTTTSRTSISWRNKNKLHNRAVAMVGLTSTLLIFQTIFWFLVNYRRQEILLTVVAATNDSQLHIGFPQQIMVLP